MISIELLAEAVGDDFEAGMQLTMLECPFCGALDDPEVVERFKGLGIDRVFIDGARLKQLLDTLKGPITKVGDSVRKARAEQGAKKD